MIDILYLWKATLKTLFFINHNNCFHFLERIYHLHSSAIALNLNYLSCQKLVLAESEWTQMWFLCVHFITAVLYVIINRTHILRVYGFFDRLCGNIAIRLVVKQCLHTCFVIRQRCFDVFYIKVRFATAGILCLRDLKFLVGCRL